MMAESFLLELGGPHWGTRIPLPEGMTFIGRTGQFCDVVVNDLAASMKHAAIRRDADGFWISDLGSRVGTFVNGEVLNGTPRRLRNWDRIELGRVRSHWLFMESQAS